MYTNWATKQPDAPGNQTACAVANSSNSFAGGWSDVDCSEKNGFVCRIRRGRACGFQLRSGEAFMLR